MKRLVTAVLVVATGALTALGSAAADSGVGFTPVSFETGFAARTITPIGEPPAGHDFWQQPETGVWSEEFTDENGNGCWDDGEPFVDDPGNTLIDPGSANKWDGIWTNAGFGGKCALGKLDDTWARAVVVREGSRTIAMTSIDVVGFFQEEIERAQNEYEAQHPDKPLDAFVVASTHTHEGPDTMGLWGNFPLDGKFPLYQAFVRDRIVEAVASAYETMEPADVTFGHGTELTGLRDSRPPDVRDPDVWAARFTNPDGATIGTIVNWSNHPESLSSRNSYISSDFPHAIRERMEQEYGGTSIFFSGSVGGLMTPLRTDVPGHLDYECDPEGGVTTEGSCYQRMVAIGETVAEAAIEGLASGETLDDPAITVAHKTFFIPSDNQSLRALNMSGMFDKPGYTAGVPLGTAGEDVKTEMYAITIGPAVFVTVPGELFPEIAIGGYGRDDTSFPEGHPNNCPAADTGRPYEPVIREQFDEASYHFVLGLGMDELGYIVPGYDYWAFGADTPSGRGGDDPTDRTERWAGREFGTPSPVVNIGVVQAEDPCGERHYEETVSASSVMAPIVACTAAELAGNEPWDDPENYPACVDSNTTTGPWGVNPGGLTR